MSTSAPHSRANVSRTTDGGAGGGEGGGGGGGDGGGFEGGGDGGSDGGGLEGGGIDGGGIDGGGIEGGGVEGGGLEGGVDGGGLGGFVGGVGGSGGEGGVNLKQSKGVSVPEKQKRREGVFKRVHLLVDHVDDVRREHKVSRTGRPPLHLAADACQLAESSRCGGGRRGVCGGLGLRVGCEQTLMQVNTWHSHVT